MLISSRKKKFAKLLWPVHQGRAFYKRGRTSRDNVPLRKIAGQNLDYFLRFKKVRLYIQIIYYPEKYLLSISAPNTIDDKQVWRFVPYIMHFTTVFPNEMKRIEPMPKTVLRGLV